MSKPVDDVGPRGPRPATRLVPRLAAIVLLGIPLIAASGLVRKGSDEAPRAAPAGGFPTAAGVGLPAPQPAAPYLLRCWQYGTLIVEEPVKDVPVGNGVVRLQGSQGGGAGVWLVPVGNALCQVRGTPASLADPVVQQ